MKEGKAPKRNYWTPRILLFTIILAIVNSVLLGLYLSPQGGIYCLVVTLLGLGAAYALRCLMRTSLPRVQRFYMLTGFLGTAFFSWVISGLALRKMFDIGSDYAAALSIPFYVLGGLPGIWLGKLLAKRAFPLLEDYTPEDEADESADGENETSSG